MGDMGSHYERDADDYRAKAMAKFGHLTNEEIGTLETELDQKIRALKAKIAEIANELRPLESDSSLLCQVWVRRVNERTLR